ncbi:MAG TPA: S-adenosylmethionine:tRNA ribosyltransferase-isomerase [Candidatus Absconditabacterales bacterium]|nr:S-adenosylmethionine:tRNA ribosyltransferase-isomerase [Candidatus Absconditabacterales bacterium]
MKVFMLDLHDYFYELSPEKIAQNPVLPQDHAKLLVFNQNEEDFHFFDLPDLLDTNSVLFFNTTKVLPARVTFENISVTMPRGEERIVDNGEFFCLEILDDKRFEGLIRLTKRVKAGSKIHFSETITITVDELTEQGVICSIDGLGALDFFEKFGTVPLPPYIDYDLEKSQHYHHFFAEKSGSVAAPTASLHFTPELLKNLEKKGIGTEFVTLQIGLGTFKPVDTPDISHHQIHKEKISVSLSLFSKIFILKKNNFPLVAVGTTVMRTLESLPYVWKKLSELLKKFITQEEQLWRDELTKKISLEEADSFLENWSIDETHELVSGSTQIFLYPGKTYRLVDQLITNFHAPHSSLLMLVAGFIGYDEMKKIYQHGLDRDYRFLSFGDGMLLIPKK